MNSFKLGNLIYLFLIINFLLVSNALSQSILQSNSPIARKKTEKTVISKDDLEFNKITYFEPNESIFSPNQILDYDMTMNGNRALRIGNVTIDSSIFKVSFYSTDALSKLKDKTSKLILFQWPLGLLNTPTIEFINRTGDVIWKKNISKNDLTLWEKYKADQTLLLNNNSSSGNPTSAKQSNAFSSVTYGVIDNAEVKAITKKIKNQFKVCFSFIKEKTSSRFCTAKMYINKKEGILKSVKASNSPRVLVNNEEVDFKKVLNIKNDEKVSFYSELLTGESYEFITEPSKVFIVDAVEADNGEIKIVGYGPTPNHPFSLLTQEQYSRLTQLLGFEPTIKDHRVFWQLTLPQDSKTIYFSGENGGVFNLNFNSSLIPKESSRIYLHKNSPIGTYRNSLELKAIKNPKTQVSSTENEVELISNDTKNFIWKFKSDQIGEVNKSYLNLQHDNKKYRAFYEVFRSQGNELSARFTGILSDSGQVILGEIFYSKWFEYLFAKNYYSYQRWGLAAKHFISFNSLSVSDSEKENISATNIDLKYRFTPGLWTRDESTGLMISYQNLVFGQFKVPMTGVGWFWARSMPRGLDNFFNLVSLFRYPKWVDMEIIYYTNAISSKVQLNAPINVNFHGQILWSKSFFGEAGFGIKRFAFTDQDLNQKAELTTFYGTIGLGFKF